MDNTRKTYFVQCQETLWIKIGSARDPKSRLRALQTGCPELLTIVATIDQDRERELQARFNYYKAHGEWYLRVPNTDTEGLPKEKKEVDFLLLWLIKNGRAPVSDEHYLEIQRKMGWADYPTDHPESSQPDPEVPRQ